MKNTAKILVIAAIGIFALISLVRAATYNFYFNNTEQGDHSTAKPTVSVNADAKTVSVTDPAPKANTGDQKNLEPMPPVSSLGTDQVAAVTSVAKIDEPVREQNTSFFKKFRFGMSAFTVRQKFKAVHTSSSYTYSPDGNYSGTTFFPVESDASHYETGGLLNLSFHFNRYLATNGYIGIAFRNSSVLGGLEAQVTPFHFSIFGREDAVELAGLGGVSNASHIFIDSYLEPSVAPYFGAKVTIQISDRFALTTSARFFSEDDRTSYTYGYRGDDRKDRMFLFGEVGLTARL